MTKRVAVILSGSGVYDGSEIHEAVCTLLALDQAGASVQCFAPNIDQHHVINHMTGEEMDETRNVMVEAARIARGKIMPLHDFIANDFDAVMLPGGFGAAKNLCDFAFKGEAFTVLDQLSDALKSAHELGKPIAALCISPVILAKLFEGAKVTLGAEGDASKAVVNACGAQHVVTGHGEVVIDENLNLITEPCYMLDATISQVYEGALKTVKALIERA